MKIDKWIESTLTFKQPNSPTVLRLIIKKREGKVVSLSIQFNDKDYQDEMVLDAKNFRGVFELLGKIRSDDTINDKKMSYLDLQTQKILPSNSKDKKKATFLSPLKAPIVKATSAPAVNRETVPQIETIVKNIPNPQSGEKQEDKTPVRIPKLTDQEKRPPEKTKEKPVSPSLPSSTPTIPLILQPKVTSPASISARPIADSSTHALKKISLKKTGIKRKKEVVGLDDSQEELLLQQMAAAREERVKSAEEQRKIQEEQDRIRKIEELQMARALSIQKMTNSLASIKKVLGTTQKRLDQSQKTIMDRLTQTQSIINSMKTVVHEKLKTFAAEPEWYFSKFEDCTSIRKEEISLGPNTENNPKALQQSSIRLIFRLKSASARINELKATIEANLKGPTPKNLSS